MSLQNLIENVMINMDMTENSKVAFATVNRVNNCIASEMGKAKVKGESVRKSDTSGQYTKRDGAVLRFSEMTTVKFEADTLNNPAMALDALLNWVKAGQKKRLVSSDYSMTEDMLPAHVQVWLREIVARVAKEQEAPKLTKEQAPA